MVVYSFSVEMSCESCGEAIKRVVSQVQGVKNVKIDLNAQRVDVAGNADPEAIFKKLLMWAENSGKRVSLLKTPLPPYGSYPAVN